MNWGIFLLGAICGVIFFVLILFLLAAARLSDERIEEWEQEEEFNNENYSI